MATPPVRPCNSEGETMQYQDAKQLISDVMLVTEDGEGVAAGTRDQMYSFVKHHVEDGDYLILEGDEAACQAKSPRPCQAFRSA